MRLRRLQEACELVNHDPYCMPLHLFIGIEYLGLGYPDLAAGATYKALLLVDALSDESDEYHEVATNALQSISQDLPPKKRSETTKDVDVTPQEAATEETQNTEPAAETTPEAAPETTAEIATEPATETAEDTPMQTDAPAAEATEELNTTATEETTEENAQPSETESTEQPESTEQSESAPAPPEEEPATWAGVEEDTSSPDEEELKKIESSDGDYSALECLSHCSPQIQAA